MHEAGLCSGTPLFKTIPVHVQWCVAGFIVPACPSLSVLDGCHSRIYSLHRAWARAEHENLSSAQSKDAQGIVAFAF